MKIKMVLKENQALFQRNMRTIKTALENRLVELPSPWRTIEKMRIDLLENLLSQESLLYSKFVSYLGSGGFQIVFEIGQDMVLKISSRFGLNTPNLAADRPQGLIGKKQAEAFETQAKVYQQDYDTSYKKPQKTMTYAYNKNAYWLYAIVTKLDAGKEAFTAGSNKPISITHELPQIILRILDSELNIYQDLEGTSSLYMDGDNIVERGNEISFARRIAIEENIPLKLKVKKLLYAFEQHYYQIKRLTPYRKQILKKILREYILGVLQGQTDFKIDNIGITSNGDVVWFDKMDRDYFVSGGGTVIGPAFGLPQRQPHPTNEPHFGAPQNIVDPLAQTIDSADDINPFANRRRNSIIRQSRPRISPQQVNSPVATIPATLNENRIRLRFIKRIPD